MVEGNVEGAWRCIEEEMPDAGVEPNDLTWDALEMSHERLSRIRSRMLREFLAKSEDDAARVFMDELVARGVVDENQFEIMDRLVVQSRSLSEKEWQAPGGGGDNADFDLTGTWEFF